MPSQNRRHELVAFWKDEARKMAKERGHAIFQRDLKFSAEGDHVIGIVRCADCWLKGGVDSWESQTRRFFGYLFENDCKSYGKRY